MKELIDPELTLTRLTQLEHKQLHHTRDDAQRHAQLELVLEALGKKVEYLQATLNEVQIEMESLKHR